MIRTRLVRLDKHAPRSTRQWADFPQWLSPDVNLATKNHDLILAENLMNHLRRILGNLKLKDRKILLSLPPDIRRRRMYKHPDFTSQLLIFFTLLQTRRAPSLDRSKQNLSQDFLPSLATPVHCISRIWLLAVKRPTT